MKEEGPRKNQENKPDYTSKMREFVIDYAHDISSLFVHYNFGGLEAVAEALREHTPRTFEEYLASPAYETPIIEKSEMENPILKQKISRLEELGKELKIKPLTKETFEHIREEVKKILSNES